MEREDRLTLLSQWVRPALAAAAAGVLTFFFVSVPMEKERIRLARTQAELERDNVELRRKIAEMRAALDQVGRAVELSGSPALSLATLHTAGPPVEAGGRLLWDRQTGRWLLVARGFPPSTADLAYRLHFVTDSGERIAGERFTVRESGRVRLVGESPADPAGIVGAEVAEEETGKVHLIGRLVAVSDRVTPE